MASGNHVLLTRAKECKVSVAQLRKMFAMISGSPSACTVAKLGESIILILDRELMRHFAKKSSVMVRLMIRLKVLRSRSAGSSK